MGGNRLVQVAVPPQLVLRIKTALFDLGIGTDEHAVVIRRLVQVHQLGRVRVQVHSGTVGHL